MVQHASLIAALLFLNVHLVVAQDDVLIADFEGDTYGNWQIEGRAFGPGPAKGTLPGQMSVTGFKGEGLVNSFFEGDGTTGTLTSSPLTIERDYLTFLIGGGAYEGATCINLLHDGQVVRTAVGPNSEPGGSEELALHCWDVKELAGQTVVLQIVDRATGGWGHINVDHIVLTNQKPDIPIRLASQTKELTFNKTYLLVPIRDGAKQCRVDLEIDGTNVREFDAELASTAEEVSFWSFLDVGALSGQTGKLIVKGATEQTLALIVQADDIPNANQFYREALRPQFHFSQMLGWNNDPNGMVYYDGEWHLYFQHNPYGWKWGNMHWGHAVSQDLVHWRQLPIAIYNKRRGDYAFSGSAVVDSHNTAGWQTGDEKVIVASWTSTGRGECVAYSNDRGRTFTEYEGNPVVKHQGRDPKIIWYEPGKHWVMVVYDESKADGRAIAFYQSDNLKSWTLTSKLRGFYECPELFELAVDGEPSNTRWVVFAADARYVLGSFDGKTFKPDHTGKHLLHQGAYYASQTFNNSPDGRRIQIGWARIPMPKMPFNQTFTFPHRLTLRSTADGIHMFAEPIKEIELLHKRKYSTQDKDLSDDVTATLKPVGELFDIRATFAINTATQVGLDIGGEQITYDVSQARLNGADLRPVDGKITLQVLVDRPMMEVVGNSGRVYVTQRREKVGDVQTIKAFARGGDAKLIDLDVFELNSIWDK